MQIDPKRDGIANDCWLWAALKKGAASVGRGACRNEDFRP